jgi:hypothetical protein
MRITVAEAVVPLGPRRLLPECRGRLHRTPCGWASGGTLALLLQTPGRAPRFMVSSEGSPRAHSKPRPGVRLPARRVAQRRVLMTQESNAIVATAKSRSAASGLQPSNDSIVSRDEVAELRARLNDANDAFADARDKLADELDQLAAQLDMAGAARDAAALDRDVHASERDRRARLRDDGSDAQASIDRLWAGTDRDLAAGDRADAHDDRKNAAANREQASEVRHTAAAARHAAEQLVAVESMFGALRDRHAIQRAQGVIMQRDNLNESDAYARLKENDPRRVRVDLARPQGDGDPNVAPANEHDIESAEVQHRDNT